MDVLVRGHERAVEALKRRVLRLTFQKNPPYQRGIPDEVKKKIFIHKVHSSA
jgi:hypothetical protein